MNWSPRGSKKGSKPQSLGTGGGYGTGWWWWCSGGGGGGVVVVVV